MPTARTMIRPPTSLMAQITPEQLAQVVSASKIVGEYATDEDPASAKEMLAGQMAQGEPPRDAPASGAPAGGGTRYRSTKPPEHEVDWGGWRTRAGGWCAAAPSNTILRGVFAVLRSSGRR